MKTIILVLGLLLQAKNEISLIYDNMHRKSYELAWYTYQAAKAENLDSLLLTHLINSESSYNVDIKHRIPEVKGLSGVHTKYWDFNVSTPHQQIRAGAKILRHYLDKNDQNMTKALHNYKGKSKRGLRQAKQVEANYLKTKENQ